MAEVPSAALLSPGCLCHPSKARPAHRGDGWQVPGSDSCFGGSENTCLHPSVQFSARAHETCVWGGGQGGTHQVTQKPHPGNRGAVRFCTERKINANGINKILFGTLCDS